LSVLLREAAHGPKIVVGDFNQAVPRLRAPLKVYAELQETLSSLAFWTKGLLSGLEVPGVCHVAGSTDLILEGVRGLSRCHGGNRLSDHDGVMVDLAVR
jgi:endonuclease/exonuclease/phosphatase family metal-dependent hydrolase